IDVVMFCRVYVFVMELEGLKEEVEYLVEIIVGNANYGEELVTAVEKVFL
ncbi:hypothetical protein MMK25_31610, partial [Bacillus cereus]|nr:hypothetical protein [Bacillus cereus]